MSCCAFCCLQVLSGAWGLGEQSCAHRHAGAGAWGEVPTPGATVTVCLHIPTGRPPLPRTYTHPHTAPPTSLPRAVATLARSLHAPLTPPQLQLQRQRAGPGVGCIPPSVRRQGRPAASLPGPTPTAGPFPSHQAGASVRCSSLGARLCHSPGKPPSPPRHRPRPGRGCPCPRPCPGVQDRPAVAPAPPPSPHFPPAPHGCCLAACCCSTRRLSSVFVLSSGAGW